MRSLYWILITLISLTLFTACGSSGGGGSTPGGSLISASTQAAYDALNIQTGGSARVRWNQKNGLPSLLYNSSGYLTGESTLSTEDVFFNFLATHEDLFKLPSSELANFSIKSNYTSQHNQVRHLLIEQYFQDIPVWGARIQSGINKQGKIITITGDYYPGINIPVTPALSGTEALSIAARNFDPLNTGYQPTLLTGPDGPEKQCTFDPGPYFDIHRASLVIMPMENTFKLSWKVIFQKAADQVLIVLVDAQTGAVLYQSNAVQAYTSSETGGLVFEENPDAGNQVWVSFNGDPQASPEGWITEDFLTNIGIFPEGFIGKFSTFGNNVWAGGSRETLVRAFPRSIFYNNVQSNFSYIFQNAYETSRGVDVQTDLNVDIVNAFYWSNLMHDHFYNLGFDEAAGNFQTDNFNRGGEGQDPVHVYVQYGWDDTTYRNNAHFMTYPEGQDGSHMALRMFTDPPFRFSDSALSGDIMIHEYTHGLSNRLCGGPHKYSGEALNSIQAAAMAEAWSDWFAANMFNSPITGEYVTGNPTVGIRRHTMDDNDLSYGDIGYTGATNRYTDGEIWSATLWDLRQAFINRYGEAEGKHRVEQLVVDAMKLSPAEPTFLDNRDFILLSDRENYGGADIGVIWEIFAARGMGHSAQTNGPDDGDPVESFDLPPTLLDSITMGPADLSLNQIGETIQLSVTGHFADGSQRDLTTAMTGTLYHSSNPSIATVSGDGLITALASGSASMTVTNNGKTDYGVVTVAMSATSFILLGEAETTGGVETLALYGDYAYMGGPEHLTVVDIQDPVNPSAAATFGESTYIYIRCRMVGDHLVVGSGWTTLDIYGLSNPELPQLVGEENTGYNWLSGGFVQGDHLFLNTNILGHYASTNTIALIRGDVVPFSLTTPSAPIQLDALYNTPQTLNPEWPGSNYLVGQGCNVGSGIALIPSTTGETAATSGTGRIDIVDISDPANLSVLSTLAIPGSRVLTSVEVNGARALAVGCTGGFIMDNGNPRLDGNLTLTTLDISDPQNPQILGSRIADFLPTTTTFAEAGNTNCYTVSRLSNTGDAMATIVDTRDPINPDMFTLQVDHYVQEAAVRGNYLYTASQPGLKIYDISGIFARPHYCSTFTRYDPDLDAKAYLAATQSQMSFEYSSGPDASTDVSYQLYLNGTYIAKIDSVGPGETSSDIVLPDNLIIVGENIVELKNPNCTTGSGSCLDGTLDSWGGSVCLKTRDTSVEATWFEQSAPTMDYSLEFSAANTTTTMKFTPGPRWCTAVSVELYLNGDFIRLLTLTPGDPGFELPLATTVGVNELEFRNPTCTGTDGCCDEGQLTSWGGMIQVW